MGWTSEPMETLIPNTTMVKRLLDGVFKVYWITPNDGYLLHDKDADFYGDYDENGNGIGEPRLGFSAQTVSCSANYDFLVNEREFYAVLETELPENAYTYSVDQEQETI